MTMTVHYYFTLAMCMTHRCWKIMKIRCEGLRTVEMVKIGQKPTSPYIFIYTLTNPLCTASFLPVVSIFSTWVIWQIQYHKSCRQFGYKSVQKNVKIKLHRQKWTSQDTLQWMNNLNTCQQMASSLLSARNQSWAQEAQLSCDDLP